MTVWQIVLVATLGGAGGGAAFALLGAALAFLDHWLAARRESRDADALRDRVRDLQALLNNEVELRIASQTHAARLRSALRALEDPREGGA